MIVLFQKEILLNLSISPKLPPKDDEFNLNYRRFRFMHDVQVKERLTIDNNRDIIINFGKCVEKVLR